jgi:hypothetical protein
MHRGAAALRSLVDSTHDYKWPAIVAAVGAVIALSFVLPLRASEGGITPEPEAAAAD